MARNIPTPPRNLDQHQKSSRRNNSDFATRYGAGRTRVTGGTLPDVSARGTAQNAPQPMPPKIKGM